MNDKKLIDLLRAALVSDDKFANSDKKLVGLFFNTGGNYFKKEFIESCINEIERRQLLHYIDKDTAVFNPLEYLGLLLLLDSAGIKTGK